MMNPQNVNLIVELIKSQFEEGKLKLEDIESIADFCQNFISDEKYLRRHQQYVSLFENERLIGIDLYDTETFKYSKYSHPFALGSKKPKTFISQFRDSFRDMYERTSHIYRNVADELFNGNEKVTVCLGQINDVVIFCIQNEDLSYSLISDTDKLIEVSSDCIRLFDEGFGKIIDKYFFDNTGKIGNTRKFEITKNVYEYLKDNNYESLILFPAICMDNELDNTKCESYLHRMTYMITFGKIDDDFSEFPNVLIYDRNGLCPPGC